MPLYEYVCACGVTDLPYNGLMPYTQIACAACGQVMRRRFTVPNVQWSSLRILSPVIEQHIKDAPRLRGEYEEKYDGRD